MPEDRRITYPADAMQRVADRLQSLDWNMARDQAEVEAFDIVIDVTMAVDKLRAAEARDG